MNKTSLEITNIEKDELFRLVNERYGYDFSDYAESSIKRRINRFAEIHKLDNYFDLKHRLLNEEGLFALFIIQITVNVTEMFRDPTFFKALQKKVFPSFATYPFCKVWNAGCSTGEEAFSLAILLHENDLLNTTKIYATDINVEVIAKAKEATYPLRLMREYSGNYFKAGGKMSLSDYYSAHYDFAMLNKMIKKNIVLSNHNLVSDKSFNEFNLILCRNVLIYFNHQLQERVFELFHDSLAMFGYLALGTKESIMMSKHKNKYEVVDEKERIFRKIAA